MSEKRHAAMDAKNTGTYKKLKEQRNANNGMFYVHLNYLIIFVDIFSQPFILHQLAAPVGPSLGMRKSSSLESLQTAIQEVSLHGHHNLRSNDPLYGRAHQRMLLSNYAYLIINKCG